MKPLSVQRMFGGRETALGFAMPTDLPPSPRSEEIESEELARLFGKIVGVRMLLAPVLGMLAAAWAFFETAPWRRAVLFFVPVCVISISLFELWRYRRRGYAQSSLYFNVGLGVVGQLVLTAATGGLESPLAPAIILLALITGLLCEPFAVRAGFLAIQALGIWGLLAAAVVLQPHRHRSRDAAERRDGVPDVHRHRRARDHAP